MMLSFNKINFFKRINFYTSLLVKSEIHSQLFQYLTNNRNNGILLFELFTIHDKVRYFFKIKEINRRY